MQDELADHDKCDRRSKADKSMSGWSQRYVFQAAFESSGIWID